MLDETQLPAKTVLPPFELTVSKTNVTQEAIKALEEKYKDLPDVTDENGMEMLKAARKEVRDTRIGADKYCDEIKDQIKLIKKSVNDAYYEIEKPLKALELRIDVKIKEEEARLKYIKEEKKRKAQEKKLEIDKIIDEIKDISLHKIVSVTVEEIDKHIEELETQEPDDKYFEDRLQEVKFAIELTVERLQQLKKDTIKRDEEKAELEKREAELKEEKRINLLYEKIENLDHWIVIAFRCKNIKDIEVVYENLLELSIDEANYQEFLERAKEKRSRLLSEIKEIILDKQQKLDEEKEAQVEKERIKKEKADLKKLDEDLKAREKEIEESKKPVIDPDKEKEADQILVDSGLKSAPAINPKSEIPLIGPEINEAPLHETYDYLCDLFQDDKIVNTFIDHLTEGKIPHVTANWAKC